MPEDGIIRVFAIIIAIFVIAFAFVGVKVIMEEIIEGIAERLWCFKRSACMLNLSNREWSSLPDGAEKRLSRAIAKEIMGYEGSRGCVLKVERELAVHDYCHWHRGEWCFTPKMFAKFIDDKADYAAIEPLIEV